MSGMSEDQQFTRENQCVWGPGLQRTNNYSGKPFFFGSGASENKCLLRKPMFLGIRELQKYKKTQTKDFRGLAQKPLKHCF